MNEINEFFQQIALHARDWWWFYGLGLLAICFLLFMLKKIWSEI